jgi:mono/diheme cytochrome c family protein
VAVAVALLVLADSRPARPDSIAGAAGDPAHGAVVWVTAGCGACHAFAKAGSTGTAGNAPNLDRWLAPDAAHLSLSIDLFAYRRILFGGRGMPAYGSTLSPQELNDLVSFVTGDAFSAPAGTATPVQSLPSPPPLVTASTRTVASWVKAARLPARAEKGAAVFARVGCLSCHRYLGSGRRKRGAADLSRAGSHGRSTRWLLEYVARPYAFGNTLMPTYADLEAGQLRSLAAFLAASHGRR